MRTITPERRVAPRTPTSKPVRRRTVSGDEAVPDFLISSSPSNAFPHIFHTRITDTMPSTRTYRSIFHTLKILQNGGVIMKMMPGFSPGQCPLTEVNRGTVLTISVSLCWASRADKPQYTATTARWKPSFLVALLRLGLSAQQSLSLNGGL